MALVRREWPDLQDLVQRWFEGDAEKSWLRVEEFVDDKTLVVRAELPDIDPEKDVDISVVNGELRIKAERQAKSEHKEKDSYRSEFQYGSYLRTITLPPGATEADVTASYKDGVLEIRVPFAEPVAPAPTKIPITRK
nr:Hsp20/alpha crystallin family protein [Propionibacterium sp.]